MADSFETIIIPEIQTADISYGYNSEVLKWTQIDPNGNRNISRAQFYALSYKVTGGLTTGVATNTLTDLVYTGQNWFINKAFSELIYSGLWAGNEQTGTITKYTTLDSVYEKNLAGAQVAGDILIPSWRICEINSRFLTTTQTVRLDVISGSKDFLFWNQTTNIDLTSTNPNCTLVSISSSPLKLRIKWASSTNLAWHIDERPIFWIFIKIY